MSHLFCNFCQYSYDTCHFSDILLWNQWKNTGNGNLFVCLFVWKKLLYSKWLSTCFLWWICSWSQKGSALSPESFQITDKKTCKVCDLSSPLYSMVGFNTVRSVKDCPTAYRLRLVPWHHYVMKSITNQNLSFHNHIKKFCKIIWYDIYIIFIVRLIKIIWIIVIINTIIISITNHNNKSIL